MGRDSPHKPRGSWFLWWSFETFLGRLLSEQSWRSCFFLSRLACEDRARRLVSEDSCIFASPSQIEQHRPLPPKLLLS